MIGFVLGPKLTRDMEVVVGTMDKEEETGTTIMVDSVLSPREESSSEVEHVEEDGRFKECRSLTDETPKIPRTRCMSGLSGPLSAGVAGDEELL